MLKVDIDPAIASKLKKLIEEEDNEDAVIRIRETKVGGCKSRIVLNISIDEREDPDEEVEINVDGVPIVAGKDVIDGHGEEYELYIDEHDMPAVRPKGNA